MFDAKRALRRNPSAMVVFLVTTGLAFAKGPKMKPEELVARHLEALGSSQARANIQSRSAEGAGRFTLLVGGSGSLSGPANFLTQKNKLHLSIKFNHLEYAAEQVSFDGKKTYVGDIKPGRRSQLGDLLLKEYNPILKEGLWGGVLSVAWPLQDLKSRRPKLKYKGLKKVNEQELLELEYRLRKGGGDLDISLFFHPETYRHTATTYKFWIAASMGNDPLASSLQTETRVALEEWFSNFQMVGGLNLPAQWTLRLSVESGRGTYMGKWDVMFRRIAHNLPIDPKRFVSF